MATLQLFFEEEMSDQQRSILLVDIMNGMGFSKSEREIHRHRVYLEIVLANSFRSTDDKWTHTITGSKSVGMRGGINYDHSPHDTDTLMTLRNIKLYTPRENNISNPPLLVLNDNEDYDASFFVEEDGNFPGYVRLSLAEVKNNSVYLDHCTRMNNDKLYLSSYMINNFLHEQIVPSIRNCLPHAFTVIMDSRQIKEVNGVALTATYNYRNKQAGKNDLVFCIHHDMWPNSANSFIIRDKPNKWPSNSMLENIKSQGYDVAPVGHHDSQHNDTQWRISFPGEESLLLDLTDVQILCYALIKIILRENLNTSQREVVSSFQIKHAIFWCVELCSCHWVYSNYINCLNICLTKLIEMIKIRHIPHYILESRNLFSSKMTETMSNEIVDVLSTYHMTHVFTLDAFEIIFKATHYNNELLKREAFKSTIMACFLGCTSNLYCLAEAPFLNWKKYIPHNAKQRLLNYVTILQTLQNVKGVSIHYVKYLIKSMVGFLYYANYKESNKTQFLLASKRLIQKSLNLEYTCVKLRAATFFLTNMEYSKSFEICDTFFKFPPRYRTDGNYSEWVVNTIQRLVLLLVVKTTDEIENIMTEILPMFYRSVQLKSLRGYCIIRQQNPIWIFRNFTNIFFHELYTDVTFMTAEKWAVPDPILYELLSLSIDAEFPSLGIHLDPSFVCCQTKFLCYHSIRNVSGMDDMLTLMSRILTDSKFSANCVYLNMFALCQIKAGHHRQSVKYILQSLHIFPSRYNAGSGYLRIVLQILNSLSI
jgi:hypothetical protein